MCFYNTTTIFDMKLLPRSETRTLGAPKRQMNSLYKTNAIYDASCVTSGNASDHLLKLSMIRRMY